MVVGISINIARLHPLIVHMPIGILFFGFAMHLYGRWKKDDSFQVPIQFALLLSFASSLAAIGTGWMLGNEGGYDMSLLDYHRYSGIGLAVVSGILLLASYERINFSEKLHTALWYVSIGLLFVVGHFGGSLTHGTEYLFESGDISEPIIVDIDETLVYAGLIEPIFIAKCNSCHNPSKLKGDLLMTTIEGLQAGGKHGAIFDMEEPMNSEVIVRMGLPLSEKKHMPPKGKAQLTDDEKVLLTWWIENKACFECKVSDMEGRDSVDYILQKYQSVEAPDIVDLLSPVSEKSLMALRDKGVILSYGSDEEPVIKVSFANKEIDPSQWKAIQKVKENIIELDLGGSSVTDQMLSSVDRFSNLLSLKLQNTAITDKSIGAIQKLPNLELLNLYNTAVTDEGIQKVGKIPTLRRLFLWKSKVTDEGVATFKNKHPLVDVSYQLDEEIFGVAALGPPEVIAKTDLFVDTVSVALQSLFRNVKIHYTLDGTMPDSTSEVYTEPILLTESTKVLAVARKEGWDQSELAEKQFIKTGYKLKDAVLASKPASQYRAKGPQSLIDLEQGSEIFRDGYWIGHEGAHLKAILELDDIATVEKVFVSSLSEPGSWIFHPDGIEVRGSKDGKNFKLLNKKDLNLDHRVGTEIRYSEVEFEPSEAKYLEVTVKSILKNPDWHPAPGGNAWVFVDEIMVN